MGHVADTDSALLLDRAKQRALVVDHEVEDAVLVRQGKRGAEDGGVAASRLDGEVEAVEGGQHGELELHLIAGRQDIWLPAIVRVFRDGNEIRLQKC